MEASKEAVRPMFDLATTYVQLDDGPQAFRVEVDDEFWATIDRRAIVREPGDTLHITRGAGTQHRPR